MKLIAHRGNLFGPNPVKENTVDYIEEAIAAGYDCEIDLWYVNDGFFLGHDKPDHFVHLNWLKEKSDKLWIHCKNLDAMNELSKYRVAGNHMMNYFWHEDDQFTLTSRGWIWAHPKALEEIGSKSNAIAVLPEQNDELLFELWSELNKFGGICSDYIGNYNDKTGSV